MGVLMKKIMVLMALLLSCQVASSGYYTGNDLKNWSEATDRIDQGRAREADYTISSKIQGYVTGVSDTLDGYVFCVADGTTVKQLLAITSKYLVDHPSEWNYEASVLVTSALRPVFPCKK